MQEQGLGGRQDGLTRPADADNVLHHGPGVEIPAWGGHPREGQIESGRS